MQRVTRSIIPSLVLLMIVAASFTAIAQQQHSERTGNEYSTTVDLRDRSLFERLDARILNDLRSGEDMGTLTEFIVQFDPAVRETVRLRAIEVGYEIFKEFEVINAFALRGLLSNINELALEDGILWVEANEELEYFMDVSTTTINATKVWNTWLRDQSGNLHPGIDGTGITVVDLDSGIDAGHPDLDYGEKVILNLKSDADLVYTEAENTDTSSGHGTHVAGTIAGTGDASGGARKGVAPGAKLIGISTGEAVAIINALGALEWVYENSRPNANPYNIRVVSNSWGTNGPFDPNDAIVKVSEKLVYDNNVVVVFAAGNEGEANHDGVEVTTNPYSLTPGVISVAATEREGGGLAYFSSRGQADANFTWPDIAAPGVKIWATEARKTLISAELKQNPDDARDGYYMAISGTSMATPHVSGLVALLFQAAPSLRVSDVHDEFNNQTIDAYGAEDYWQNPLTRIHEAELIMKLTAEYMDPNDQNGVPKSPWIGLDGKPYDFGQGYGMINADRAVQLALTLEGLRELDRDATVWDALQELAREDKEVGLAITEPSGYRTDTVTTSWQGDWSRLNDAQTSVFTTQSRMVYVPLETKELIVSLTYSPFDSLDRELADLRVTIDYDNDGEHDWLAPLDPSAQGAKFYSIDISANTMKGNLWSFDITGFGIGLPSTYVHQGGTGWLGENDYRETIVPYYVQVSLVLDLTAEGQERTIIDWVAHNARYGLLVPGEPSEHYLDGEIELVREYYHLASIGSVKEAARNDADQPLVIDPVILILLLVVVILAVSGGYLYHRRRN